MGIILCQKEDYERYDFELFYNIIGHDNNEVIISDGVTEGAACTLLLAKRYIDNGIPLLSFNTDQMIDYDVEGTFNKMKKYDGGIPCFWGDSTDWSYAKTNDENIVTEVAEKNPISDNATVGVYYWKHGSDYVKYAEQMIKKNIRVNNEFYVCPVFNEAILDKKRIIIDQVEEMHGLGTPDDLNHFLNVKNKLI